MHRSVGLLWILSTTSGYKSADLSRAKLTDTDHKPQPIYTTEVERQSAARVTALHCFYVTDKQLGSEVNLQRRLAVIRENDLAECQVQQQRFARDLRENKP